MTSRSSRSERIDTMRGIACMLLVLYHVIGDSPEAGLRIPYGHGLRDFNDVLVYFRMPMFAFLSGLVYAMRPFEAALPQFLAGKFRRLIVPMLIVGTVFFWIQSVAPGVNAVARPWTTIHIYPVAHFWFLESMFWIFALVAVLDGAKRLAGRLAVAVAFIVSGLAQHVIPPIELLGIGGAIYLLPYFLIGLFVTRFGVGRGGLGLAAAALTCGLAHLAWLFSCCNAAPLPERTSVTALAIGAAACLLMNASGWSVPWLARIGVYSFGIYMFHVFFAAGSRIVLQQFGVSEIVLLGLCGWVAGILGPIVLERVTKRHAPAAYRWVFGAKARSARATAAPREAAG